MGVVVNNMPPPFPDTVYYMWLIGLKVQHLQQQWAPRPWRLDNSQAIWVAAPDPVVGARGN
ncbi:hypothetical protein [Mycobacterium lepromatosis]|uniref:hypothetical protein n=1 Tax=Mycobacterium lepromatosis TaxID=480418 RepID=UPI000679DA6F|nr:hypothetical protein [Mycobacterium lepromatosis]